MSRRFQPHLLAQIRRETRWSREQLAAAINSSYWSVRDWERGRTAPSAATLARIADALGCAIDDLFAADAANAQP
jgi:transcriptional regulator with XRE-family HTH domain